MAQPAAAAVAAAAVVHEAAVAAVSTFAVAAPSASAAAAAAPSYSAAAAAATSLSAAVALYWPQSYPFVCAALWVAALNRPFQNSKTLQALHLLSFPAHAVSFFHHALSALKFKHIVNPAT